MLSYPWSVIAALVYTYALVVVYALSERFPRLQKLCDARAGAICIGAVAVFSILFGLIPQDPAATGPLAALGWTQMRRNPVFVALLVCLMTTLGLSAIAGLYRIRRQGLRVSTLAHLACYLVFVGGLFGAGDKQTVYVTAVQDQPVSLGKDADGMPAMLPFMLVLNDFTIEEYPAAPGPVDTLTLDDGRIVTMPPRVPKGFRSDVTIRSRSGERQAAVAVNHPARVGAWRIYQYGYDRSQGSESRISELLCVRDGWYPLIAAGLWLLLGTGAWMFLTAGGRRKKEKQS